MEMSTSSDVLWIFKHQNHSLSSPKKISYDGFNFILKYRDDLWKASYDSLLRPDVSEESCPGGDVNDV